MATSVCLRDRMFPLYAKVLWRTRRKSLDLNISRIPSFYVERLKRDLSEYFDIKEKESSEISLKRID